MEEIVDGFDHDVRETSEKILMNVAQSHALEEKKTVVFYFYETGRVSIHIKALSALAILKEDFVFMSCTSPSEAMRENLQLKELPTIAGILPPTSESDNMRQFAYGGSIDFNEILDNLLKLSGKEEEYYNQQKNKGKGLDRKFEEITN